MKTFLLENKLALITGGGSGIGFGVAQAFIAAGARVVLTGRRKDALERAVAELGPRAQYIVNDVTRHKMIPPLVAEIERSEEHTSELQSLMRISYAVFCLKK